MLLLWHIMTRLCLQDNGQSALFSYASAKALQASLLLLLLLHTLPGGLLKIEDILPFFPDFFTIDNFKGAITDSLMRYNRQIEDLKGEMDEATEIAGAQG
jgi:hypothetical protein